MKRYIKIALVALLAFTMMNTLWAATNDNTQLDAVLVIDASGSMQDTDPNKLGLEGVKLFVDMLSNAGNQVGVVTYGDQVDKKYELTQVNGESDKEQIKQFVDAITRKLEYTDITSGLGEAITLLDNRSNKGNGSPLIIIFTDGNNAIGGVANRTEKDIAADLKQEIKEAQAQGYPVYTIGLNGNGKLNEDYLKSISEQTNALAFATNNPDELPDILTQIFVAHSRLNVQDLGTLTGTGAFEKLKVTVPNENVLEANIAATSKEPIQFKLTDPMGNNIAIPSSTVSLSESSAYQLLKIEKPMAGDWTLEVQGVSGDQIKINLVYNYDVDVVLDPLAQNYGKGDSLNVSAYLSLEDNKITDDSMYQNAKATLIVTSTTTGVETRVAMQLDGQSFKGNYQLPEEGDFEISVLVEDTSYSRESNSATIHVGKQTIASHIEKPEENSTFGLYLGLGGGVVAMLLVGVMMTAKLKEVSRPLVGQIMIEIRDNQTGKLTAPQYKKLNVFKGKVNLHTLLQFAPEFKEAENIILKASKGDKVLLFNRSTYSIEKMGRTVKTENGLALKQGDRLTINITDVGQTIQIQYLL